MSGADCGNPTIDGLARVGRMAAIWDRLAHRFPMVAAHAEEVWHARRSGRLRSVIERDTRFTCLRANPVEGPSSEAEWVLLAMAALEAVGRPPAGTDELARHDGLWIGMPIDHPHLVARHAGCSWCADGWLPCPGNFMPDAHVGPNGGSR